MKLDPHSCYEALRSRDPRYDGQFFVGVKTTRIYCRPICPARPALFRNVVFYRTAAEAAEQGFRPCKRCRPESAAGSPSWNGTSTSVSRALKLIDEGFLSESDNDVGDLARTLGLGERHLRALFVRHVGVAPKSLADTKRLDFARSLIDGTGLAMTEIACASGFSSVRRFNDAVRRRYRATPTQLRKASSEASTRAESCYVTHLAYRPPYDWTWMTGYLSGRALAGVEVLDGDSYSRSFRLPRATGWFRVTPEVGRHRMRVEIFAQKTGSLMQVTQRIRNLLDLNADPMLISEALSADKKLRPIVARFPGTRLPGSWDGFEASVKAIVGQSISVRASTSVAGRVVEKYGEPLEARENPAPTLLFPLPEALAKLNAARVGLTRGKACAIRTLSRMVLDGELAFDGVLDLDLQKSRLLSIPGVGPWTVDYLALKLSDPDAFPSSDLILARCLKKLGCDGNAWRPWRGYATHYLWRGYATDCQEHR